MKKFEELKLHDDFVFGIIMRNPKYCKPFLETILNVKISHIEYLESQKTLDFTPDAHSVRLDVYVEDGNGTVYNIEMQIEKKDHLPKRMRYYQSMIDLNMLEKGATYGGLKRSFVILVCTFDLFGKSRHVYIFENRCIQDLDLPLGDDTIKIVLNTKGTMNDVTPEMEKLLNYIDGKEATDDFTRELDEAVKAVKAKKKWKVKYMTLYMHYQEKFEEGMAKGMAKGMAEGRAEGRECEKVETVKRLIKMGILSLEDIAKATGLSLEKVKKISC